MDERNPRHEPPPESIELPASTSWPFVTAVGLSLAFAGILTHVAVTLVGLVVAVLGGAGWWREVLPAERHEEVPLRPPARRARPVQPVPAAVERLEVGIAGHRMRLPVRAHPYTAGIRGGLAGGAAMAVVACAFGVVVEGSPWYPINLLSAVALPTLAGASVEQLRAFSALGLGIAMIVHGAISVFVGLIYAVVLPMLPGRPVLWGGIVAPALWSGLIWASLGVVNPALNARISWLWFIASQVAFGLVAGIVVARTEKIATMQAWPLSARAGVEAPGLRRGDRAEKGRDGEVRDKRERQDEQNEETQDER